MIAFRAEEIDIKIKNAENRYAKAERNAAERSFLIFLKRDIEYLKELKQKATKE